MMASLPLPPHPGGVTAKEFYDALEERDKEMRERREEASSSSVIRGTCPDMCPEKERYLREFQRRLSRFEVLPGSDQVQDCCACCVLCVLHQVLLVFPLQQVDHSLAVKEYSKSAADQVRAVLFCWSRVVVCTRVIVVGPTPPPRAPPHVWAPNDNGLPHC